MLFCIPKIDLNCFLLNFHPGKGLEMDTDTGNERVVSDVVGGVCGLAGELKAGLRPECERTRIHVLEVPVLPMYDLPGNEGMREDAENINAALKSLRDPIQLKKMA